MAFQSVCWLYFIQLWHCLSVENSSMLQHEQFLSLNFCTGRQFTLFLLFILSFKYALSFCLCEGKVCWSNISINSWRLFMKNTWFFWIFDGQNRIWKIQMQSIYPLVGLHRFGWIGVKIVIGEQCSHFQQFRILASIR